MTKRSCVLVLVLVAACGGSGGSVAPDGAVVIDAAAPDAAVPDAAVPDAAVPDAAVPDAAVPDAPPTADIVVRTLPADGDTDAELTGLVEVMFDDRVIGATVHAGSFFVTRDGAPVPGVVRLGYHTYSASFMPDAPLEPGATYTATVSTEVRTEGGLTLAAPYAWRFTAGSRTWDTAPFELAPGDSGNLYFPKLARSDDGAITAVWERRVIGAPIELWSRRFTFEGGWQTPVLVDAAPTVPGTDLAAGAGGIAIVVWSASPMNGSGEVRFRRFTPAGGWSAPARIDTGGSGSATGPRVALDGAGTAVVTWKERVGDDLKGYARHISADGTVQPAVLLDDEAHGLAVAADAAGNATATWWHGPASEGNHWFARYAPGTGWSAASAGNGIIGGNLTPDATGALYTSWIDGFVCCQEVMARRFDGTAWSAPMLLGGLDPSDVNQFVDAAGAQTVVWHEIVNEQLLARRFTPAGGWEPTIQIGDAGGDSGVGGNAAGELMTFWKQQRDGAPRDIHARRYVPGVGWKQRMVVRPPEDGATTDPRISVAPDGRTLVLWGRYYRIAPNTYEHRFSYAVYR